MRGLETQMRNRKKTNRAIALVGLLTAMLIAGGLAIPQIAGAATPNPAGPPGNNGTIKIHTEPSDSAPHNQPHVTCVFTVNFYGYDKGDLFASVTFTAHPPTLRSGDDQVLLTDPKVFIGEDSNAGGGSTAGLDASRTYTLDLSGITPHFKQGVHVKLTIHADGSKGNDTKHKVFWVKPCEISSTTTTTTISGGGGGGAGGTTTTTLGGGGAALPFTGSKAVPIAATGLLLLVVGAGGVLASRRMGTR